MRPREPRDEVIDWAQAVISNPSVVFLDTETTGLDGNAEIIDIALVDRDGAVLLDTLIRPTRPIPWGAPTCMASSLRMWPTLPRGPKSTHSFCPCW